MLAGLADSPVGEKSIETGDLVAVFTGMGEGLIALRAEGARRFGLHADVPVMGGIHARLRASYLAERESLVALDEMVCLAGIGAVRLLTLEAIARIHIGASALTGRIAVGKEADARRVCRVLQGAEAVRRRRDRAGVFTGKGAEKIFVLARDEILSFAGR